MTILPQADANIELGEYEDSGLFGQVYRAKQLNPNRDVAVKVINPDYGMRFNADEHAQGLARAGHRNVVTVFTVTTVLHPVMNELVDAVVLEWLEGTPLGTRLNGELFNVTDAKRLCLEMLDGLEHIHRMGMAHNDFHANNVFLTSMGVKIIDIHYEKADSLRLLSDESKDSRIADDIRRMSTLVGMVFRCSTLESAARELLEQAIRDPRTLTGIRAAVNSCSEATVRPQVAVESESRQLERAIEQNAEPTIRRSIVSAATQLLTELGDPRFSFQQVISKDSIRQRIADFESISIQTVERLSTIAYFSKGRFANRLLVEVIDWLAHPFETVESRSGPSVWLYLHEYPALLAFYAAGLSAVAGDNLAALRGIVLESRYQLHGRTKMLSAHLLNGAIRNKNMWNEALGRNLIVPANGHLEEVLRPAFAYLIPEHQRFQRMFDRFEYLVGVLCHSGPPEYGRHWGPIGTFVWRRKGDDSVGNELLGEIALRGQDWEPLKHGLFGGEPNLAKMAIAKFEDFVDQCRPSLGVW